MASQQEDQANLKPSITEGTLKESVFAEWGRQYQYKIVVDSGQYGDVKFAFGIHERPKDGDFFKNTIDVFIYPKDVGVTVAPKQMDLFMGKCDDATIQDDGVRTILNALSTDYKPKSDK